jgi:RNA polymerase sigma-70 factor (ECF subfamily)
MAASFRCEASDAARLTPAVVPSSFEERGGPVADRTTERAVGDEEDVALWRRVVEGDRRALAELYDRHGGLMLALARRILGGDGREAEDLVHDVFLEAWRQAADFDAGRGSVRAWLVLRLRSRALDRKKSAGFARVDSLDAHTELGLRTGEGEDQSLSPDRERVKRALAELPAEQREVLLLGYFEGLSSSEIAERLGTPIGTVKSRVAAALSRLRAALRVDGGGGGGGGAGGARAAEPRARRLTP